jgi:hypothetical protein
LDSKNSSSPLISGILHKLNTPNFCFLLVEGEKGYNKNKFLNKETKKKIALVISQGLNLQSMFAFK